MIKNIPVHKTHCVFLRNLNSSLYSRLWVIFSNDKTNIPVKEAMVPQTSVISANSKKKNNKITQILYFYL